MEDKPVSNRTVLTNGVPRVPLGMNSFGQVEREQFGRRTRLAMACIEGTKEPIRVKAMPDDEADIRLRLKALSREITSQHADLLELLVRFDELEGWKAGGARHCAAWMNHEIGISTKLAWEYLRAGRALRSLPTIRSLFRAGSLEWSKVRMITRVANENNEELLARDALDASVSAVKALCDGYRWNEDIEGDGENDKALMQWQARSLSWSEASNGNTCIRISLPPDMAQAFLNSVEHSLNQVEDRENGMSKRRADAAALMAEASLQSAGKEISTADRYQVIVSVDATELSGEEPHIPARRPTMLNAGPIARETAKRISCDCSLSVHMKVSGEPVNIGRKSRVWPAAMTRAIKERDKHCVWPGCAQSRHLHIHHIQHWSDGGETSIENGACLCSGHHTLVHEGGYTIQRIGNTQQVDAEFQKQQHSNDLTLFDFERVLRGNRTLFDKGRELSSDRYRFTVVDSLGRDIRDGLNDVSVPGIHAINNLDNIKGDKSKDMISTEMVATA